MITLIKRILLQGNFGRGREGYVSAKLRWDGGLTPIKLHRKEPVYPGQLALPAIIADKAEI